jgi:hypothetical protein
MPVDIVPRPGALIDGGAGFLIQSGIAVPAGTYTGAIDAYGNFCVMTEGTKPTYSAGTTGTFTLPATPTQVVTIIGSATKTIRVLNITISGSAAVASQAIAVGLQKLSTAPTGGTPVTPAVVPHDSASPTGSAVVTHYTGLPTLGTALGYIRSSNVMFGLITATTIDRVVWDFTTRNGQGLVLRGTSQGLAVNLNGIALANATLMSYSIEWTEE